MSDDQDLKRLRLLENAIMNYSGGIISLEGRVMEMLLQDESLDANSRRLFKDLSIYFRDVRFFLRDDY